MAFVDPQLKSLRENRPNSLDLQSGSSSRRGSYRGRTPSFSGSACRPASQLVPEPAYIALSAAIQIVNSEYVSRGPMWLDIEAGEEGPELLVSPAALALVNSFLDHMLFNFLKGARSTSIVALKPAINDVLKPRLAKDAIQGADEELRGYLLGGEDEELSDFHNSQEFKGERNLQRIFRTTRLRCMVYTRLGDMEEEDEELYLKGEQAQESDDDQHRLSRDLGNVSPAAAIFLTSIIEFIGEQTLMIAGEAAFARLCSKSAGAEDEDPSVLENDVEKVAFNTTLGRLWRSWKNRVRPASVLSPRDSLRDLRVRNHSTSASELASRTASSGEGDETGSFDKAAKRGPTVAEILHDNRDPASIPLPAIRGFPDVPIVIKAGRYASGTDLQRPRSMIEHSSSEDSPPEINGKAELLTDEKEAVKGPRRQRSSSLPLKSAPYISPISDTFATPTEGPDPFVDGSEERAIAEKEMLESTDDSQTASELESNGVAVSTMYDGVITGQKDLPAAQRSPMKKASGESGYTQTSDEEHDNNMTPQALRFNKLSAPATKGLVGDRESQASTMSSEYSFGPNDPTAPTGIFGLKSGKAKEGPLGSSFPNRGDSSIQSSSDAEDETESIGASKNIASITSVQEDRLRTYDESGKAVKRDIPVLYEHPSNQNVIYNPKAPTHSLADDTTESFTTGGKFQGVPPLTPLRELRDAAADTSDEASSVALSYDASRFDDFPAPHIPEIPMSVNTVHTPPITAAINAIDPRQQPPAVNTGTERAAVQRVSPSSATARDSPYGRTSTSSNREGWLTPSVSNSAKINQVGGRDSGDMIRPPAISRVSQDTNEKLPIRYSKTPKSGDKELDFESLINSDETMRFTLTPQNMREMEDPDSPRWSNDVHPNIRSQVDMDFPTSRPSGRQSASPSSQQLNGVNGLNGLRSNPPTGPPPTEFSPPSKPGPIPSTRTLSHGPIPKSPGGRTGAVARDASMKDESMRDFADFIRSTGPDMSPKDMYKTSSGMDKHSRSVSSNSQQASPSSGKPPLKKMGKSTPVIAPKSSGVTPPTRSSSKLRAREPTIPASNTTADLADFLRSGPPGGYSESSTSFQQVPGPNSPGANGVSNGRAIGSGTSLASTQDSFAPSKMTQSSANSRTGLLDSTNRNLKNGFQRPNQKDELRGGPVRKSRRPRDPYSLDSDDDEEDTELETQVEQEDESLSDFLRNYKPSEGYTGRDVSISHEPPIAGKTQRNSGTTMRERIARNIAVIPDYRPLPPKAPSKKNSISKSSPPLGTPAMYNNNNIYTPPSSLPPPPPSSSFKDSPPSNQQPRYNRPSATTTTSSDRFPDGNLPPLLDPRSSSPHLIPQQPNGARTNGSRPTRPKPQARDERTSHRSNSGMSDLAEFLRDTEPPAPTGPILLAGGNGGGEREGGFGRVFGRKKR